MPFQGARGGSGGSITKSGSTTHSDSTTTNVYAYVYVAQESTYGRSPTSSIGSPDWVVDSDATHHFTPHLSDFNNVDQNFAGGSVRLGDGSRQPIQHFGSGILKTPKCIFQLKNLLI